MEFDDLKKKVEKELDLKKPDFINDAANNLNIGYLDLSSTQKLLFSISNFRGKKYIDIRTWFQDQSGEWKPTKKGIHFDFEKFQNFETLIKLLSNITSLDS